MITQEGTLESDNYPIYYPNVYDKCWVFKIAEAEVNGRNGVTIRYIQNFIKIQMRHKYILFKVFLVM